MSRWLRTFVPRPDAELCLVCFPHAGGSATAYHDWVADLPDRIEVVAVQYPGRADRLGEPAHTTMSALADAVVDALEDLVERPYALFGHSMGAAVAYETAVRLRQRGSPAPIRLVVSGREAPRLSHLGTVHRGGEPALVAELHRFGFTQPALLHNPELRAVLLATMAADCELIETYRPTSTTPLTCPISAVVGEYDPELTVEEAAGWGEVTSGGFDLTVFPGDHFYLVPHRRQLLDALARCLWA